MSEASLPLHFPNALDTPVPEAISFGLAGAATPDITRFLHVRSALGPSLSPDGRRLAFRTSITGQPQLWVVDARGGWPHQLTFGESVTFHEWSPAGQWIAYGSDRGGNEREGFYLVAPDGMQEHELLAPAQEFREFGGFSPDGRHLAYATSERNGVDFDIHVRTLDSGEDRLLVRGEGGLFVASWRPDGRQLLLRRTRGEDANDVLAVDLGTGAVTELFRPREPCRYGSFAWLPDGSGFYLVTDQDRDLCAPAFFGRRGLEFLAAPPHEHEHEHEHEQVRVTADGRWLIQVANVNGYSRIALRDLVRGIDLAPPELPPGVQHVTVARAAPVVAVQVSGPRLPGDLFVWDLPAGLPCRATFSAHAGLDLARMVLPEAVQFAARDGEQLHGLLYRPRDGVSRPPVLLALHGGPTAQARPVFHPVHQYLLGRGIAILDLNFRGSTGHGKRYARLDNGRLRPNAVLDMADAVTYLARDRDVDASRVAAMGGSYGGFMTLAALTTFPALFRGGVAMVAVSNWITALEGASPQLKASDKLEYGDIEDPADREFFRELSPLTHVHRIRAPLMIVHGANDPRDPVTEADQIVRAIRERGGSVEYLRFPDEGHGIRKLRNRIIAYRRIAAFLERVLGA